MFVLLFLRFYPLKSVSLLWQSAALALLYCPHLTTGTPEWKTNVLSTGHGAVVVGKTSLNSNTTLPADNLAEKSRHDACLFFYLFIPLQHAIVIPRLARSWGH